MRPFIFFVVIALLVSCDKDDPTPVSIVGKWNMFGYKSKIEIGGKPAYDYFIEQGMTQAEAKEAIDEIEEDQDFDMGEGYFEFKSDGAWVGQFGYDEDPYTAIGTWKLSDDHKTLTILDTTEPECPETVVLTVPQLTTDLLQLEIKLEDEDDFERMYEYTVTITFKRAS